MSKKCSCVVCVLSPSKEGGDVVSACTQYMNTSYPREFNTNNFICILYFNIYCELHI